MWGYERLLWLKCVTGDFWKSNFGPTILPDSIPTMFSVLLVMSHSHDHIRQLKPFHFSFKVFVSFEHISETYLRNQCVFPSAAFIWKYWRCDSDPSQLFNHRRSRDMSLFIFYNQWICLLLSTRSWCFYQLIWRWYRRSTSRTYTHSLSAWVKDKKRNVLGAAVCSGVRAGRPLIGGLVVQSLAPATCRARYRLFHWCVSV